MCVILYMRIIALDMVSLSSCLWMAYMHLQCWGWNKWSSLTPDARQ